MVKNLNDIRKLIANPSKPLVDANGDIFQKMQLCHALNKSIPEKINELKKTLDSYIGDLSISHFKLGSISQEGSPLSEKFHGIDEAIELAPKLIKQIDELRRQL